MLKSSSLSKKNLSLIKLFNLAEYQLTDELNSYDNETEGIDLSNDNLESRNNFDSNSNFEKKDTNGIIINNGYKLPVTLGLRL